MADELVSIALHKIANSIGQQLCLFAGAAHELERLRSIFESIQAVLHDAESRQLEEESVRLWLSKLRDVSHDVDDVLDDWEISEGLAGGVVSLDVDDMLHGWEISGGLAGGEGDGRNKVFAWLFSLYNYLDRVVSRCNATRRIKEIRKRLNEIDVEKNEYGFISRSLVGDHCMPVRCRPLTSSLMDESAIIIGRENDKETMISRLVGGSSSHEGVGGQVPVVAVVGTGGLGKTTLVRQIYHDGRVRDHFNMLLWVYVSDIFDVKRLTKAIIEQVKGTSSSLSEVDSLRNELLQELIGKHFLLVLDDVWNDDEEKWKMLQLPLNSGAKGSRILVTTRTEKVANTMNATYIHQLQGLSDDHSWKLFRNIAFAGWKAEEYSVLESVGKDIVVNNCRGVPLVIKGVGRLMHSKVTVEDWESILYSKIWSSTHGRDKFLPALFLNYLNIPSHLKQCFEYCSTFPKGWEFKKDSLVRLWVALGFIWPQRNREIEDVGEDYFDELAAWSMLQQVQEDGEARYKMQGLYYDMAEFIFTDEIYISVGERQWLSSNVHHAFLSFADNDDKPSNISIAACNATKLWTLWLHGIDRSDRAIVDILGQAKSLRAFSLVGSKSSERIAKLPDAIWKMRHLRYLDFSSSDVVELPNAIGKMRHLRYLDLSSTNIVELPNVIGKMKYLKYLNLSCLNIVELPESVSHLHNLHTLNLTGCVKLKMLPESVSHLRNLHTLNLTGCVKLKRLPRAMGGMVSLGHLEIERTDSLECLPEGLGRIHGLRSLCKFIVGGSEGGCHIDELRDLNSLHGTLRIHHLDRVSSREEAEGAGLWAKRKLRRLVLSRSGESAVEGLRPHFNLEELKLFWYTGSNLPDWTGSTLCLRKLELCGCLRLEGLLHHLDGFSIIEELIIRDCPRIEGIANSSSCVYLERISVIDSSEFFSSGVPHLRNLKIFEIRRFRKEALTDVGWELLTALQTLEIWNCDELKSLPDGLMHLRSLENLIIHGCDKLERLPEGLGQLKELRSLTIGVLKALTCLPGSLEQLESLKHLEVSSCKKLESLPHGLQQLRRLSICGCPLLSERCKREGGVDWPKISHIPNIEIDKRRIQ